MTAVLVTTALILPVVFALFAYFLIAQARDHTAERAAILKAASDDRANLAANFALERGALLDRITMPDIHRAAAISRIPQPAAPPEPEPIYDEVPWDADLAVTAMDEE